MIESIRLIDFKNFADATLTIGPFTVIIGTNASGKSNIRDAFRFIHGIGRGYTLAEIIGGRYGAGGQAEWAQLRGAASEIVRFGQEQFEIQVRLRISRTNYTYVIRVSTDLSSRGGFRVVREELKNWAGWIFTSHPGHGDPVSRQEDESHLLLRMDKTGNQRKYGLQIAVRPDQPALTQIANFQKVVRAHKEIARQVAGALESIRFLDLVPEAMRKPAFPGQSTLGDSGENLPTVLQGICADQRKSIVLRDWIRELTPMDVEQLEFPKDPITGLVQLAFRDRAGNSTSAYSASDGTLRFLSMLAALLGEEASELYFFEEIDNGIHPTRLRLLLDLIEARTESGNLQVVTTTHSPDLLSMIREQTFENTSVVFRLQGSEAADIRLVKDLRKAESLRISQGLGRLHATGWLEDALEFEAAAADEVA